MSYVNPETGQCIEGIAKVEGYTEDPNNQQLEITAKVGTVDEAKELAEKNLRLRNKFCRQAQFLLPGDTDLVAGVNVALKGWGGYDGKYIIKQAVHKLDSGDYGHILRAKGIVNGEDGWLEFDYVPEEHEVRAGHPDYTGRLCVIGAELKEHELAELFGV